MAAYICLGSKNEIFNCFDLLALGSWRAQHQLTLKITAELILPCHPVCKKKAVDPLSLDRHGRNFLPFVLFEYLLPQVVALALSLYLLLVILFCVMLSEHDHVSTVLKTQNVLGLLLMRILYYFL